MSLTYYWKLQFGANATRKAVASTVYLSKEEEEQIKKHWTGIKIDDFWFKWYKKACIVRNENSTYDYSDILWKYIPDDYYFKSLCGCFHDLKACEAIDDKNLYDLYFHDIIQPETVLRKINGVLLDKTYTPLSYKEALTLIRAKGLVVLKSAKDSCGGKGLWFIGDNVTDVEIEKQLRERNVYVVQECITQHDALKAIHPESINTLRITTFYYSEEMHVLSSVLRMGSGNSKVDNSSSGGIFCGINENGCLRKFAYNKKMNVFETHPTTGLRFENYSIPGYEACKGFVTNLAYRFLQVSQLISWDLAIDEKGRPVLIEVNLKYGDIDFHQIANGPFFGDLTNNVLKDMFGP